MDEEYKIIRELFLPLSDKKKTMSLSNDAALLDCSKKLVVSTDMMVEGTHFDKSYPPYILARKLIRVNLSDIAAMGATPYGYLLNISIPKRKGFNWIKSFVSGLRIEQDKFKIKLLGGDLSRSEKIFLSASMYGKISNKIHMNHTAKEGSLIYVSGNLGDASIALRLLKKNNKKVKSEEFFKKKLFLPVPKIDLGKKLLNYADFCTDISDGIVRDLKKISIYSNLRANIFCSSIPLSYYAKKIKKTFSNEKNFWELILGGGEDYELLFSIPKSKLQKFKRVKSFKAYEIGFFSKGNGLKIYKNKSDSSDFKYNGFSHF